MSVTYRIEVVNDLHSSTWPWQARVYDESETLLQVFLQKDPDTALAEAQEWIRVENNQDAEPPRTYYADETGTLVGADGAAQPAA